MAYYFRDELVFFDTIDNDSLFYAPTLGICLLGTKSLIERMKLYLSEKIGFPEFEKLLEDSYDSRIGVYDLQSVKSRYFHIALGLTENCTLSCEYCHADAGKDTLMDKEIIIASAVYAEEQVKKSNLRGINLSFAVGGEPTFDFERLSFALESFKKVAKKCNVEFRTSMTTNGYYDKNVAQFIAYNIENILVSLDGVEEIQNLHRPTKMGNGSFSKVIESMDVFYKVQKKLSVRATVSNKNVLRLKELIDYLADRYKSNITLVVEPLVPLGRGSKCVNNGIEPPEKIVFAKEFWDAYCYGEQRNIKVRTSALNADRLVAGFCGAMFIPSFTVTTKGIITTCERDSTGENYGYGKYDKVNKKFVLDENRIKMNLERIKTYTFCDDCICRYHCAGDCPDVRTINYNRCETNKYLLKKYLLNKMSREEDIKDEIRTGVETIC